MTTLKKDRTTLNVLLNVLMAWRYNNVAYTGDWRVFYRFLGRPNENRMSKVYKWKRLTFSNKPHRCWSYHDSVKSFLRPILRSC